MFFQYNKFKIMASPSPPSLFVINPLMPNSDF